jgi:hypothetical protein
MTPRDSIQPCEKEWQEFRAGFAAALLHMWILRDLDCIAPNYVRDLGNRFNQARDSAEFFRKGIDGSEDLVWVPAASPERMDLSNYEIYSERELELLEDQLFPHGHDERDFQNFARGLLIIALHSALESFCVGLGIQMKRTTLPKAINSYLRTSGSSELGADLFKQLIEFDETRHIFVHHRGVISERYVANVSIKHDARW